ncbi:unnamed protein product [Cochlearia groenlandica]
MKTTMSVRSNNLSSFINTLSSNYNSNVLLASLVFLLLVILFVLLLHLYARFFFLSSSHHQDSSTALRRRRHRRRTRRIIPPPIQLDDGVSSARLSDEKGLDSSVISSIPLFVYEEEEVKEEEEEEEEEECVICLGLWEVGEFGRKLRNCGHGFHVECVDMWLSSHSSCPLCRCPVLKPSFNVSEQETEAVRLQLFPDGEDESVSGGDRRLSLSIEGGGERDDRRSMSMTSSASSSLKRMLSSSNSKSERNKVFPSSRQDSCLE